MSEIHVIQRERAEKAVSNMSAMHYVTVYSFSQVNSNWCESRALLPPQQCLLQSSSIFPIWNLRTPVPGQSRRSETRSSSHCSWWRYHGLQGGGQLRLHPSLPRLLPSSSPQDSAALRCSSFHCQIETRCVTISTVWQCPSIITHNISVLRAIMCQLCFSGCCVCTSRQLLCVVNVKHQLCSCFIYQV